MEKYDKMRTNTKEYEKIRKIWKNKKYEKI